eukprot:TRINITY_DN2612_c0_g1_i2.p1 TRINITY_DN2612_c0_g1~~TRINITY_DN2612_c0_g1_i2.p1  ORF type:complete len:144 (-),score=33.47 TRINITY_DN2612_c0_g1_i2:53-424(-)
MCIRDRSTWGLLYDCIEVIMIAVRTTHKLFSKPLQLGLLNAFSFVPLRASLLRFLMSSQQAIRFRSSFDLALERLQKTLFSDEAILNVNTHRRKRTKLKKAKRKQRRKKMRRKTERKQKRLKI